MEMFEGTKDQKIRVENTVRQLPENEWENCPNCPNQGWYPITVVKHDNYGQWQEQEQEQCEFCYKNPKSVFYQENKLF